MSSTFRERKVHPRQNPGYACASTGNFTMSQQFFVRWPRALSPEQLFVWKLWFPGGLRNSCSAVRRSVNPANRQLSFGRRLAWREVLSGPRVVENRQC